MKTFLRILVLTLCLSAASAFAATYTRDSTGRLMQVASVDAQGHPQVVEYRYTDDKGRPTKFVYAVRLNGGSWCKVDPNALSGLTVCLTPGWHN